MLTRSMTRKRKLADEGQGQASASPEFVIKSSRKKGRMEKEKKYHVQLSGSIWMFCDKKLSKHGEVYGGEQRHGNFASFSVAIKLVEINKHSMAEARILAKLNHHSHVIALIETGFFDNGIEDQIYMVMDKCHNENLREFIANRKARKIPFDFDLALEIAKQIIVGVEYIHEKKIIHKDLKPDNILFTLDQKMIKIADFGLSEEIGSTSEKVYSKEQFGTDGFRPTESFGKSWISQKSDIFSLGVIFCFIFSNGENPFGVDSSIWNYNIKKCIIDLSHLIVSNIRTFQHLIKCMIEVKLNNRPTIWQVSRHPCWTGNEVECDFDYHCDDENCDIPSCPDEQTAVTHNIVSCYKLLEILKRYPPRNIQVSSEQDDEAREDKPAYIRVLVRSDIYSKKILKAIELIEARVEGLGLFGTKPNQVPYPPQDKTKQMYEHWAVKLIKHVQRIHDNEPSRDSMARKAVAYAENLLMYYKLLYLKEHIPNAIDVVDGPASSEQNSEEGRYLRKISAELRKASIGAEVPMLEKLLEELRKQFKENRQSRCIIFVPRKLIARELVKCIESQLDLADLRPVYLTGTNEQEMVGGITKNKQQTSLEAFSTGKCQVLIATSVAEEGLDICACNLVIMYNYVTNEIGRIQRAGRGRAENSRSILIAPYGSAQIEREQMNKIGAEATLDAIEDLNELSVHDRVGRIRKVQRKQERERKMEKDEKQQRLREPADWKILCGKCQAFITTADQLRQIKNQLKFVIDPRFRSRVYKKRFYGNQREVAPGVTGVGEFRCGDQKCRHYLGLEIQYKHKLYPTLTVKQLVFENKNGNRDARKQWNKCRFEILKAMEESDDEEEEDADADVVQKFASSQFNSLERRYEAEELSEEDAKEKFYLDNNM